MTMQPDTTNPPALGVIILGAGASSRMGRPKLLLPWSGTTVIGHLIQQWQTLGAAQIALVCRSADKPLSAELDRLGFSVAACIENPHPERGMFSSILCAANWAGWKPGLAAWAIVLGDQPLVQSGTLRGLVAFQRNHAASICQPFHGGHGCHPVLLPRAAFEELKVSPAGTLKSFLQQTWLSL